jgi:hypothetical protein
MTKNNNSDTAYESRRALRRFEGTPDEVYFPLCNRCIHRKDGLTCEAYPEGIPIEIVSGELDHHKPLPGDHGIQFAPRE